MTTAAIANVNPSPAAPAPQTAARQNTEPGAFARELGRAADDGQGARRAEARQADHNDRAQENKAAHKPGSETKRADDGKAAKDETDTRQADAEGEDEDTAPGDVSALLAGLLNPAARAAAAAARGNAARGGATRSEGDAAGGTAAAGRGHAGAAGAKADLAAALKAGAAEAKVAPAEAAGSERRADFRAELAAFTPQAAQAPAQQAAAPDARAAATATPYAGQIAAPVGSPDFAPGLSAQVSVMLRDGVQEARLQLNPAEMGPITVQIQVEGNNAQVVMAAQQADTRQALEQALPSLASALQEAGLTLTGGGVFEQRQGGERDAGGEPGSRGPTGVVGTRGGEGGDDAALAAAPQRRTRGVLDTYA
ncbi:flagellar hook-length control protein FliK [Rubrivivax gelatinosus]|uniref:flagellar hook-length control protein FliK n=1 Tax=Rubrivivax gelatinosus TaxID=28068 RepID=UPI0018C933E5|nr:flagellar hook-length control protein FliK [Rubrivivax gelatinosus]MBG6081611.1 flagellar hook-length control protein FliK [Rubrivivax gelatinosus]